ncbi:MAG: HDOD domain-containing protein [Ketobacter sp.]|nr:MAG: HDOD domain-containing protein [Ketobacter sp.]
MDEKHQYLIDQVNRISPLNPVMLDLLAALQNKESQASDLKHIIESDANTSASILKIANSPFYGLSGRIRSIQDACVLLGYDQLKNIIYASALNEATHKGPHVEWRMKMREHTLSTAIICSQLEKYTDSVTSGVGYASGLLHEFGKQVMIAEFPDSFSEYMAIEQETEKQSFIDLFTEIGDVLANRWHLPDEIRSCIRYHRSPQSAPKEFSNLVELVHYARSIAIDRGYTSPGELQSNNNQETPYPEHIMTLIPPINQFLDDALQQDLQSNR